MKTLKVKIKKLNENAVIPTYSKYGDAGMDLVATSKSFDEYGNVVYGTGLSIEIPKGYVGLLFPRSSNAKQQLLLSNSVGVIDSGYRGEVMLKFKSTLGNVVEQILEEGNDFHSYVNELYSVDGISNYKKRQINDYQIGDRIGQIIILSYPQIEFEESEELSETERGNGGYGSTGN